MDKRNICPSCAYGMPQDNSSLGLVDCLCRGRSCGNAYARECDSFRENPRLSSLRAAAISAIREFEKAYSVSCEGNAAQAMEIQKAAVHSCAMQEAYAIMLDISYDMASEILHEAAKETAV